MTTRTRVILGVGVFYGMFMCLAMLTAVGMLEDAIDGRSVDDFRPLAFVGLGALSVGSAGLILAFVPRRRATPVAALALAAAYGLLYLVDQYLVPGAEPTGGHKRTDLILTGSFVTLTHACVVFIEYFRTKLSIAAELAEPRDPRW